MPGESPTASKWWIGFALQRLRENSGRSRQDVADRLGKAKTWPGHIETGRNLPTASDLEVLLTWYDRADLVPVFHAELRKGKKERDWWHAYREVVPESQQLYLGLEAGAELLDGYDAVTVHELFQTPDYAIALLRHSRQFSEEHVQRRLELIQARQQRLLGDSSLRVRWVIDELVLRRFVGSVDVMAGQIGELAKLSERENVSLQILPITTKTRPGADGVFTMVKLAPKFDEDITHVVYLDAVDGGTYRQDSPEVDAYHLNFARLQDTALSAERSTDFLHRLTAEIGK